MKLIRKIILWFLIILIIVTVGITFYGYKYYKETIKNNRNKK